MMIAPQQPMPAPLAPEVRRAVSAWDAGAFEEARRTIVDAVALARAAGYA